MSTEKRKPTWTLCVKQGEKWRNIGAAWETEKGNLFVKMDEGCELRGTAMMFPYREKPRESRAPYRPHRQAAPPPVPPSTDYLEWKRAQRQGKASTAPPAPIVPTTPPNQDDDCPEPERPDWL